MTPPVPEIRRAAPADAVRAAACHIACWQEAYGTLVDPHRLAAASGSVEERAADWARRLASGLPILVAATADDIVGFVCSGPRFDSDDPDLLQLYAINARLAYWGTGLGQRLHDAAVGDHAAFLWVARDNARAIAFYHRNRYRLDGGERVEHDLGLPIVRMVRSAG